jgi:hypothetical protein
MHWLAGRRKGASTRSYLLAEQSSFRPLCRCLFQARIFGHNFTGGNNPCQAFLAVDGQNGRLRFIVKKSLDGLLATTPADLQSPLTPGRSREVMGPKRGRSYPTLHARSMHTLCLVPMVVECLRLSNLRLCQGRRTCKGSKVGCRR